MLSASGCVNITCIIAPLAPCLCLQAYERTYPVANFSRNDCGIVHIVVGCAGNDEGLSNVEGWIDQVGLTCVYSSCSSAHFQYSGCSSAQFHYSGCSCRLNTGVIPLLAVSTIVPVHPGSRIMSC